MRFNHALHPDQRLHLCVQSVAHELEFAVRRDETDCAVILEARKSDTLVELHVLHLDRLASCSTTRGLEHGFVVQAQSQLWHTTQIALHLDSAQNLRAQDVSIC